MKIIKTNRIAVAIAALGLITTPLLSNVAEAKNKDKGHKGHKGYSERRDDSRRDDRRDNDYRDNDYRDDDRHDNGKHKGWTKGKHKGWYKKSNSNHSSYRPRRSVDDAWRRTPTRRTPVSTGRLVGTFYHSSQAAAARAVRYAQSRGLRATSVYDRANNRWIVRTYTR